MHAAALLSVRARALADVLPDWEPTASTFSTTSMPAQKRAWTSQRRKHSTWPLLLAVQMARATPRTLDDAAEHDVAAVQPGRLDSGDEELAAVGILHNRRAKEQKHGGGERLRECAHAHVCTPAAQRSAAREWGSRTGPELAMDSMPSLVCFSLKFSSTRRTRTRRKRDATDNASAERVCTHVRAPDTYRRRHAAVRRGSASPACVAAADAGRRCDNSPTARRLQRAAR
jgi:hypothetical protein